jgi:hypothetical protein
MAPAPPTAPASTATSDSDSVPPLWLPSTQKIVSINVLQSETIIFCITILSGELRETCGTVCC